MEHSSEDSVPLPYTPRREAAGLLSDEDSPLTQDSPCNTSAASSFEILDWDSSSSTYSQDGCSDDEPDWTLLSQKRFSQPVHQPPPLFSPKLGSKPFEPPSIPPKSPERFRKSMRQYMEAKYAESELKEVSHIISYLTIKDLATCLMVSHSWYKIIWKSETARKKAWFGPRQLPFDVEERLMAGVKPISDTNDFHLNPILAVDALDFDKALLPFSLTECELDEGRDIRILKVMIPVSAFLLRNQVKWRGLRVAWSSRDFYEVEVSIYAEFMQPLTLKSRLQYDNTKPVSALLTDAVNGWRNLMPELLLAEPWEEWKRNSSSFRASLSHVHIERLVATERARLDAFEEQHGEIELQHWLDGWRTIEKSPKVVCQRAKPPRKQPLRPKARPTKLPIHHKSTLWKKLSDSKSFRPKPKPSTVSSQSMVSQIQTSCSLQQSSQKLAQTPQKYGLSMLPMPSSKLGRSITGRRKAVSWEQASKNTDQRTHEAMELAVLYGLSAKMRRSMPQLI
ncbi:hypothetical protein CB0940_06964 [Cercospora beticola]|uniref:F-box domain-containing protein n=1 Tax=Cercospora beticola TaxID=122368 RepID=A0A2G5HAK8_CERBT|nr:hypothetical protein CB0940_06964 [Cercospora beticola]PIA89323.1 hypothetical protein CB0940_06964 [Cercospora beticola]WPB02882.1 hypothetical protein RHO25_007518 [Cercospora beticola]CAK1358423.1 unnamed protein product [Cercospora beticola]